MIAPPPSLRVPVRGEGVAALGFCILAGAAVLTGIWFGEAGELPGLKPALVAVGLALLGGALWRSWVARLSAFALLIAAFGEAWWMGSVESQTAYNECVNHGEEVRVSLSAYHRTHGQYPSTLRELGKPEPCRRLLRGTWLHYERSADGYNLWFSDWLVTHSATEAHRFGAHK